MIAAIGQMFSAPVPEAWKEETVFDLEFTDAHMADGTYCQVQFEFSVHDGSDAFGVDWGDGTAQEWPKAQTLLAHNWDRTGRFRVKFDRRLKWFRFTTAYAVDSSSGSIRAIVRPYVDMVQWGDWVESGQGTFSNFSRGVRGSAVPWGRSMKDAFCCYQYCTGLTGGFPKWGPSITDCTGTYDGCTGLAGPVPAWPKNMTKCNQCYRKTGASGTIPAWPANVTSVRSCYNGCKGLTGAWTNDPVLLMPESTNWHEGSMTGHDDAVADASDAIRALFYEDWGGTRTRPE